jgi:hypothetical protein
MFFFINEGKEIAYLPYLSLSKVVLIKIENLGIAYIKQSFHKNFVHNKKNTVLLTPDSPQVGEGCNTKMAHIKIDLANSHPFS